MGCTQTRSWRRRSCEESQGIIMMYRHYPRVRHRCVPCYGIAPSSRSARQRLFVKSANSVITLIGPNDMKSNLRNFESSLIQGRIPLCLRQSPYRSIRQTATRLMPDTRRLVRSWQLPLFAEPHTLDYCTQNSLSNGHCKAFPET